MTKEILIKLHKLGKQSGFQSFKEYEKLLKDTFGDYISPDIQDAHSKIKKPKDFAHYVLIGRKEKIGDFSKYELDKKFDVSLLGY